MRKTKKNIKKILSVLLVVLISSILGIIVGIYRHKNNPDYVPLSYSLIKGTLTSGLISLVIFMLEFIIYPVILRRIRFMLVILIKLFSYIFLSILIFISVSFLFIKYISLRLQLNFTFYSTLISLIALSVFIYLLSIHRLLGARILLSMMSGRYHNPIIEKKIFMFLDIADSTSIAERIGHIEFHKFLNDFFFDINDSIIDNGGEIYKYVGDEVIVVWKFNKKIEKNIKCINCYLKIKEIINNKENIYKNKYGFVPKFRAGFHCGNVISGEMGDTKKEITYLGDTVNTTSRIQSECRNLGKEVLLSKDLVLNINTDTTVIYDYIGKIKLRGKINEIELYTINNN